MLDKILNLFHSQQREKQSFITTPINCKTVFPTKDYIKMSQASRFELIGENLLRNNIYCRKNWGVVKCYKIGYILTITILIWRMFVITILFILTGKIWTGD